MQSVISAEMGAARPRRIASRIGRVLSSQHPSEPVDDPPGLKIVGRANLLRRRRQRAQDILRSRMLDQRVRRFVNIFPSATVVDIGCGLSKRFERVDNGRLRWFDIDSTEVIGLRRRRLDVDSRRTMLASSIVEGEWFDVVQATGGPWIFVADTVLTELEATAVRRLFRKIADRFLGALIAFDSTDLPAPRAHDGCSGWRCSEPRDIESWHANLYLAESVPLIRADLEAIRGLPWAMQRIVRWLHWLPGPSFAALRRRRVNLFRVS